MQLVPCIILTNAGPLNCSNGSTTVRWVKRCAAGMETGRTFDSADTMIPLLVVVTNAGPLICSNGSTMVRWAQRSAAGTESGCTSQGVVETITMDDIYSYLS